MNHAEGHLGLQMGQLKTLFVNRWKQLIIIFLVIAVPATIISLNKPVLYPVSSKLLFEQNRRVNIELSSQLSERAARSIIPAEKLNSQIQVIKGNHLLRKLVHTLNLSEGEDGYSREVLRLQKQIGVRVIPASTIIEITYEDADPKRAQLIVNTLTNLFRDFYLENVEGEDVLHFYEVRFQKTANRLHENYRKLEALRASQGLVAGYSKTKQIVADRVFSLQNQISNADLKIGELEAQAYFLKSVLDRQPRETNDVEYHRNPNVNTLEDQLAVLEMERNHLATLYTDSSREIKDKDEEIQLLKQRILASEKLVEGKIIHSVNPLREETEKQLTLVMATLSGLRGTKEKMNASLASSQDRLVHLNRVAYEFASVENAVAAERKSHSHYLGKLQDARFIEAMKENEITSVSIIQRAEAPPPDKKAVFTSAAMSSGFGALIAFAIVFLLDFLRPKLNSAEQIAQMLRLPVIGTVTENGFREKS